MKIHTMISLPFVHLKSGKHGAAYWLRASKHNIDKNLLDRFSLRYGRFVLSFVFLRDQQYS